MQLIPALPTATQDLDALRGLLPPGMHQVEERGLMMSLVLLERATQTVRDVSPEFIDFSYIVFPAAKAYESFLKRFLFTQGLLNEATYNSRRFRIGRAMNPDVPDNQRDEFWLYDDVAQRCGTELARQLWDVWLNCRNHVFHAFPGDETPLNLADSKSKVLAVLKVITQALSCKMSEQKSNNQSFKPVKNQRIRPIKNFSANTP